MLLSTFNGVKYIDEFLTSLVNQSFKHFDLFVRDDASVDETISVVNSYSDRLNIHIFRSRENLGPAMSFMNLLVNSGSEFDYYFFADQDDCWYENKIELALSKLVGRDEQPSLYFSALELVDSKLNHLSFSVHPKFIGFDNALVQNVAIGCTMAFNSKARSVVLKSLPKVMVMHDWWFYIVISAFGAVLYDKQPSLKYRQHSGNVVGAATNIYQDFNRRVNRFFSRKKVGVFCIGEQVAEFYRCYHKLLSTAQIELVQGLLNGKKSVSSRIQLVFNPGLHRQKFVDNFILRILFLIGKY